MKEDYYISFLNGKTDPQDKYAITQGIKEGLRISERLNQKEKYLTSLYNLMDLGETFIKYFDGQSHHSDSYPTEFATKINRKMDETIKKTIYKQNSAIEMGRNMGEISKIKSELSRINPPKKISNLEKFFSIASLGFFLLSFFFLSLSSTGNVISSIKIVRPVYIHSLLFLAGMFFGSFWIIEKYRKEN